MQARDCWVRGWREAVVVAREFIRVEEREVGWRGFGFVAHPIAQRVGSAVRLQVLFEGQQ